MFFESKIMEIYLIILFLGVKMGRIPKIVKEKALREQQERQLRQETQLNAANERTEEVHVRESSCSSLSDRSIENYDPNVMDSGIENILGYPVFIHCMYYIRSRIEIVAN